MQIAECEFEQRPHIRLRKSYAKGIPNSSLKLRVRQLLSSWWLGEKATLFHAPAENRYLVWRSKSKTFPQSIGAANHYLFTTGSKFLHQCAYESYAEPAAGSEAEKIINRILLAAIDPDMRDEDEQPPEYKVIKKAIQLVRGAEKLLSAVPPAQVSIFYGEINITWRSGNRIVRLACFPDRPTVIQTGSLSLPIGSYRSEENPTSMLLAARLLSVVP